MKSTFLTTALYLYCLHITCQTREILFEQIQKDNGVLYGALDLVQDQNGFIWFRTAGNPGIQRYDGYEFVNFLDSSGLFNSIMVDRRNLLWLGTSTGIALFNPEREQLIHFRPDMRSPQNMNNLNNVVKIIEDKNGTIWCATSDGVLKLEPRINQPEAQLTEIIFDQGLDSVFSITVLRIYPNSDPTGINQVSAIYQDERGRFWIGSSGCLYLIDPVTNGFTRMDDTGDGKSRLNDPVIISCILEESTGFLWVGTGNGIYRISNLDKLSGGNPAYKEQLVFDHYLDRKLIMGMVQDNKHNLWIGTYLNGLVRMHYNKNKKPEFHEMYTHLRDPEGEGSRTIYSLMKDRTGLIWVGHEHTGIRKFDPCGSPFTTYNNLIEQNFTNYDILPILKDTEHNLWIGTFGGGLYRINPQEVISHFNIFDNTIPHELGNGIMSLLEMDKGQYWVGSVNGIWQFNAETGKSRKLFTDTNYGGLKDNITDMVRAGSHVVFALWGDGMYIYNLQSKSLRKYPYDPNVSSGLRSNIIYSICRTGNGDFYCGGSRGFCKFRVNAKTGDIDFIRLPVPNSEMESLGTVYTIHEDKTGALWFGTNNGLFRWHADSAGFKHWTVVEGLSFNIIRTIEEDQRGRLWLGTANGLTVLDPESGRTKIFNTGKGLPIDIHGLHSSYKDTKGVLYFGGIGGYYSFHPDSMAVNTFVPPVKITIFRLFGKSAKTGSRKKADLTSLISVTHEIKLAYFQNDISFEFAALDFNKPDENRYAYKLEGYQNEWIETGADNRIATYTNINPGKYVFRVIGSNNDGTWNEEGAFIHLTIRPPLWKRPWAYLIYAVLLLLLLRGYIIRRTLKLKREKAMLEQQVVERTQQIERQKKELQHQKEELQTAFVNLQSTQEQLVESEKMAALGSLVAGVAHEINTPVGIGITAISTLMDDVEKMAALYKLDELNRCDFKEFLQTTYDAGDLIRKNLERTAALIQSFKQISVDQVTEQKRLFRLRSYLDDIILSLYPKYKQKNITFDIACDDDLELNSYPGAFAQIFSNLLLNSFIHGFHAKAEGTVTIRVHSNEASLHIQYLDDGNGISRKDLPHIFEPFYTSDQHKGTGLGLNIIYNLIRQKLNGTISCASEPGTGVAFNIRLPLAV